MPYPSPITYPSPSLYPGFAAADSGRMVSIGDLVLGAVDPFGVEWTVAKFDGWAGSPSPTLRLTQRPRGHGATASESYLTPRIMTLEGLVKAPTLAALDDAFDRLNATITLDQTLMLVAEATKVRGSLIQRQGDVIPEYLTDTLGKYSVLVSAKDPLKYGDLVTQSTALPVTDEGETEYPVTYPLTYTGSSVTGVVRVNNPGNAQAPVWLRVDGPIPAGGWTVTHQGKGKSLTFSTALALEAGEFVTVDMERREVLAQGQSPRAGYVTSRGWFSLDPGVNDIAFSAQNYSSTALLTVTTKPAWA